jgi:hypothetical protein
MRLATGQVEGGVYKVDDGSDADSIKLVAINGNGKIVLRDALIAAVRATCNECCREVAHVPLAYWNESVFRFFLVRHLLTIAPTVHLHCEWNRVDLAFEDGDGVTLVEIKFYPYRGLDLASKGGPSKQNFREFEKVVLKLESAAQSSWGLKCGRIVASFLVLVYVDPIDPQGRPTFGKYYDDLKPIESMHAVHPIVHRSSIAVEAHLTCKLLEIVVPKMC